MSWKAMLGLKISAGFKSLQFKSKNVFWSSKTILLQIIILFLINIIFRQHS